MFKKNIKLSRIKFFVQLFPYFCLSFFPPLLLMKKILLFSLYLLAASWTSAQSFTVSVSGTVNTDCIGQGCFYDGPTILINEVMLAPTEYDGSLVNSSHYTNGGGEWIELYNPHKCDSVDISCYFLGNNARDNSFLSGDWGGGFALPPGTVVPPQGFCLVRGFRAPPVPDSLLVQNGGNVVEVVVDQSCCMGVGGGRFWFPNFGGWFAFYDANGVPQDAISWGVASNSCMTCPPCLPKTDCPFADTLPSYSEIPEDRRHVLTTASIQDYSGEVYYRSPDGGEWESVPGYATYATCNADCNEPPLISCAGTATATPNGGTPPYTYLWNDPSAQTTETAVGLCAGTYSVTVTDANNHTATSSVTIVNFEPPIDFVPAPVCLSLPDASAEFTLADDLSQLYPDQTLTWHWDFGDGNTDSTTASAISHTFDTWDDFLVTLSLKDSNGCESAVSHYVYVDGVVELPNVITPNGDGINDVLAIGNLNPALHNVLTVYDRWGRKVFEMENYKTYVKDGVLYNPETGFTALDLSDGVYYYTLHCDRPECDRDWHSSLTVIR